MSGKSRKPRKSAKIKDKSRCQNPPSEKDSREACPHCVGGEETYGYLKRAYVYDVDEARVVVSDGREPVDMDASDVAYCVDNSRIHEQHLDHVDPRYPGILAHLWGPGENGTWEHGHLLIDGNHRAARCLRDNLTFRAYLLTEDESERILRRGPGRDGVVRSDDK
jgi:hypothetical protein